MWEHFFSIFEIFENFLWGYICFPVLMLLGLYLSLKSNFVQVRQFPTILGTFFSFMKVHEKKKGDVHPLKAFFACIGGCVGVGNIVGICTAVQIGGPGALLWIWVTAFFGSMVKYAEVYLGLRYRVVNPQGGYNGGPMYFLRKVYKTPLIPNLVCLLLCVYGVEIYQFSIVTNSIAANLSLNPYGIAGILLVLVLFAGSGGVRRIGNIASMFIPLFVVLYVGMGFWVLWNNVDTLPAVFRMVFSSAFTGHAAMGGFFGSTLLMTISQGVRRGCYSSDLGIGYASVIHSESCAQVAEKQASLVIFDIFLDTFIVCTSSLLVILVTDVWHQPIESGMLVQMALSQYFPYMNYFMPFFLFALGYSTINAYFCVGLKSAEYLSAKYGRKIYYLYATATLLIFSVIDPTRAQSVMMVAAGLLLALNCYGIFMLRKELSYKLDAQEEIIPETDASIEPLRN
jgi:AGCS family alanine or glycine:cation symporter